MSAIKSSSLPKTSFLVFYSSIVDGKMWCPDCVDVEPSVRDAFDGAEKPEAQLFYVGKKEEWRTPENVARVDWIVRGFGFPRRFARFWSLHNARLLYHKKGTSKKFMDADPTTRS